MKRKTIINLAIMVLIFSSVTTAFAQEDGEIPACSGNSVSGTVVAVDGDLVTVDTGDGNLCTVSLSTADYDHPIITLLDIYFSGSDGEDVAAAFEGTQEWVAYDEASGTWGWASEGDEGAVQVTVSSVTDNGDGTFTVVFTSDGGETFDTIIIEDGDLADELNGNLEALNVDWGLVSGEDGSTLSDAGDEIAAYHEDGFGFGVLVKLYAIVKEASEACKSGEECLDVSVGQLVDQFDSGTGMGALFQEYGKPAILGIGHVRQELDETKGYKTASYEVDGSVWVVYDEESEAWALADEEDEGALPATIIAIVDNEDGTQTLELSVEGVEGSVFITVEASKKGKAKTAGKPSAAYEVDGSVWVVYDEESEVWALAGEDDEGALAATVIDITENEDGTQTLELSVEGVEGTVFITVEGSKKGKPKTAGKADKGKPDTVYEVDGGVWVVYDEGSGSWALAGEEDEGAVSATIIDTTEDADGNQVLELSVEGVEGSVFITVEAGKKGKPDNGKGGKPETDSAGETDKGKSGKGKSGKGKSGSDTSTSSELVWVVFNEDSDKWLLAAEEDEGARAATVVATTEDADGNQVLELSVEGVDGTVFVTVEGKGNGKPDDKGKPDKPDKQDNPNKPKK